MDEMVSVVIVNWNGERSLRACVNAVLSQNFENIEIIIVDNGSDDRSVEIVREEYPGVNLIATGRNLGFAAGNNVGIRETRGNYIVLLNNDAELEPNCISEMKRAIDQDRDYGVCASKICLKSEPHLLDAAGIVVCPDGLAIGRGRLERDDCYDREEEVFFGSGCCLMCRKVMLEDIKIGNDYLDEDFFMYADDTDLGWRARLRGWKTIYAPTARVYHAHSAGSGSYSPLKAFHVERNRIWVAVKYFPPSLLARGQFFVLKRYFFQAYGALFGKGASGAFVKERSRIELILVLYKAYCAALRGLPAMLKKRNIVQKRRTITDKEIYDLLERYGIGAREIALKN